MKRSSASRPARATSMALTTAVAALLVALVGAPTASAAPRQLAGGETVLRIDAGLDRALRRESFAIWPRGGVERWGRKLVLAVAAGSTTPRRAAPPSSTAAGSGSARPAKGCRCAASSSTPPRAR
jgi:hypothetical protein